MKGGAFRARIALGWGKSLLIERDTFYIHITQQISKGTYEYIKKSEIALTETKAGFRNSSSIICYKTGISTNPRLRVINIFEIVGKDNIKRYYGTFKTAGLSEIGNIKRTNQLANSYKSIISNFNKEHKNETSNKEV